MEQMAPDLNSTWREISQQVLKMEKFIQKFLFDVAGLYNNVWKRVENARFQAQSYTSVDFSL